MKKKIALIMAVILLVTSMLVFAGCGKNDEGKTDTANTTNAAAGNSASGTDAGIGDLDYIKNKGTLVVGITAFEPMDYKDADGNWIGFDADMATKFAESLGVNVEFMEITWENKITELDGKTIDCVWNGMTLTDEVVAAMECSKPYCDNTQVVVFKKADAEKYTSIDDCTGLTFAVERGSAGATQAKEAGFSVAEVDNQSDALTEVLSGTSNAAVIDKRMALAMIGEGTGYADLKYTFDLNSEEYGVGFRKGSELANELNKFFDACRADGSMKQTAEKYKIADSVIL